MKPTEDETKFAETRSAVSSMVTAKKAKKKQEIPERVASMLNESSVEESRVSSGIALVERASMVGLAGGAYHANFASMAHESTRRQSENAMIVGRQQRAAARNPSINKF